MQYFNLSEIVIELISKSLSVNCQTKEEIKMSHFRILKIKFRKKKHKNSSNSKTSNQQSKTNDIIEGDVHFMATNLITPYFIALVSLQE